MKEVRTYEPNSGSFPKGFTPWNKGLKGAGGRKDGAVKGKQGYQPKPVVALNADGTIYQRFPSVKAAKEFFGLRDRHTITDACQQKFFCRGHRLLYEEDYIPWADYRNKRSRFRDIYGRLLKGHHNTGFRKPSAEKMQLKSKCASERAKRMYADPNSKWGKPNGMIPVICVETGERFPSIKDCAAKLGIAPNQISAAITRRGTTHGYSFKKRVTDMKYLVFLLVIFLFTGRTEINDVFPYVHVEYPFRGLFVVVGIVLIAYYSNQIKF